MCLNAQQPKIHSKSKYNDAEVILEASLTLPCKTSYQSWFWTLMCTFSCICTNIELQETLSEHDDSGLKWFYVIDCTVWLCIQCFIHNFPTHLPQYVSSHSIFVFIHCTRMFDYKSDCLRSYADLSGLAIVISRPGCLPRTMSEFLVHSLGLCWCPWSVLSPKATRMPRVWL